MFSVIHKFEPKVSWDYKLPSGSAPVIILTCKAHVWGAYVAHHTSMCPPHNLPIAAMVNLNYIY